MYHHVRGGDLEGHRPVHRHDEVVDRGDAVLRVEEQPLPIHGDRLDLKRLDIRRKGPLGVETGQGPERIEGMGADPGQGATR